MGMGCSKLRRCCPCCCSYCCNLNVATERFKVLLLGSTGSGKTQLGHLLSGQQRDSDDLDATNGVRCFRCEPRQQDLNNESDPACLLLLTEVGGSTDMQRIWPNYYAGCHALIFCYELSDSYEELLVNFQLLQRCLEHREMRGKPVLLVSRRHCDGVQLYDVAHAFGLEQLTRACGSPLHMCHLGQGQGHSEQKDLWRGLAWLRCQLHARAPALEQRIKYDVNMQSWQRRKRNLLSSGKLAQVHRQRFRRAHRKLWPLPQASGVTQPRPCTAPAAIFSVITQQSYDKTASKFT